MKTFLTLVIASFAAFLQASIVDWSAGSNSTLTSSYANGSAYFIEVTSGGPSLPEMMDWISANGLQGTHESVKLLDKSTITYDAESGYYSTPVERLDPIVDHNDTSTYYILFVNDDGTEYVFSNGASTSDWSALGVEGQYNPIFFEGLDDLHASWAQNKGPVGVPEPTALALLALGVAGVALRRRIR